MNKLSAFFSRCVLGLIALYQATLSPDRSPLFRHRLGGRVCAHEPHCSEYGKQCFRRYPFFTARHYTMERVSSCVPRYEKQYDPSVYRVVFFSSSPIGVPFLQELMQDDRFDLVGVVTMPDMPVGRGMKVQENVIKKEVKKSIDMHLCRYFFLKESLRSDWEDIFSDHGIFWQGYEDWGIVVYDKSSAHDECLSVFQKILLDGPRYFDVCGAYNQIVYKERVFTLTNGESEQAKQYGHTLGIPNDQLDRSDKGNGLFYDEYISTPRSLRLDSKKYATDAQEFQQRVKGLAPDLFVVIAYGHIMPQRVLDIPYFGSINVHGSLLPAYRGASPLQSVFLDGKTETGLTIMKMDAGVDTGGMIQQLKTTLPLQRTVIDLIDRIKQHGPIFLNRVLREWSKGLLVAEQQDNTKASLCRKFMKEDGQIDPLHDDLLQVRQKRQAFALWPKLYFFWEGKRVSIDSFSLHETTTRVLLQGATLISQVGTGFLLHPCIVSIRLTPEGKKSLSWEAFVHGYIKR